MRAFPYRTTFVALLLIIGAVSGELSSQEALPPLTIRGGLGSAQQGIDFPLEGVAIGTDALRPAPNTPLYVVMAAAWRSVGASVSFTIPGSLDAIDERGVSEFSNLQVQFYRRRVAVDLTYQRHHGMYLTNADEISTPVRTARLPDLQLETIGATVLWTYNPSLNLTAVYRLNELPERSAVGLVWMAAASRVRLDAPRGPGSTVPALDGSVWSQAMRITSHSAIVGPGVTAVGTLRSFFVAPLISVGFGAQRSAYDVATGSGTEWNIAPQLSVRMSAGYNAPEWFAALVFVGDARNVQTPFLEATQTSSRVDLVVGRRYRMKRWRGTRGLYFR